MRATQMSKKAEQGTADAIREAIQLGRQRRRLEHKRDELTAETDRVVLALVEEHGLQPIMVADLLGVSKQRVSQLLAGARERRDQAAEDA